MNRLDAAAAVLGDADRPLSAREIAVRAAAQGLWEGRGATPWASIEAGIAVEIRDHGDRSRFRRAAPGRYELNADAVTPGADDATSPGDDRPRQGDRQMSFLDAAEDVLRRNADRGPMHYRAITDQSLAEGLIVSAGQTPDATLRAQIGVENRRREARGARPRFVELGRGLIGLSEWQQEGILREIELHNEARRAELLDRVKAGDAHEFEQLVAELLSRQGFEIISITPYGGDQGVDVRAEQMVGGVVRAKIAVQAKKWAGNVRAPTVRELRGSLSPHERGVIITTSDFSAGAREEANRVDATPVALVNWQELVSLMVENELGVRRSAHDVIELDEPGGQPGHIAE